MALGLGAQVVILDMSTDRLRYLDDIFGGRVITVVSNSYAIAKWSEKADLLIGAVLIPGAKTPKLVTEEMVENMRRGSVIVDVAIDQGGSIETCDHCTTHADPIFVKHEVIHYSVANIPGAVARTSTLALTNATLPYALKIAGLGYEEACRRDPGLAKGINVIHGKLVNQSVAKALDMEYTELSELMK